MTSPAAPLVIFIFVVIFVVLAVLHEGYVIHVPIINFDYHVKFYHPPLIGVQILLMLSPTAGSLTGLDLWEGGFAGRGKIFPFHTMVQFETLAFVCISLDMTGVLAYIALKAIQAAGSSGRRLYFYFFFICSSFTICTSNDIVILTLTPIIYYTTKVAGISPWPLLFGEFFTANICSMVLVIGNPVNLIVANANDFGFAEYSNWMAAPAIVGSCTCCMCVYILFRKDIEVTFVPPKLNPEAVLKDRRGIAFHGAILFLTRLLLGVADNMHAEGWIITTTAAFCSLVYNFIYWPWDLPGQHKNNAHGDANAANAAEVRSAIEMIELVAKDVEAQKGYEPAPSTPTTEKELVMQVQTDGIESSPESVATPSSVETPLKFSEKGASSAALKEKKASAEDNDMQGVSTDIPTVKDSIFNMPWAVMPFVYGMFTLVSALNSAGWIEKLAQEILNVIPADEGNSAHAVAVSTFLMATISFCLCTLIDNQPASILLTQVLVDPLFSTLPVNVRRAGMLGVLEGANVGGCWSLMGALAGIMWATLLRNKGVHIGYIQFMKVGLRVMPLVTFMVALIIFAESATAPS